MFSHFENAPPLDSDVIHALTPLQTSTLGHMRDFGFPRGLVPVSRPSSFVGCAVTVRIPHMDSTALHVAADLVRPGDVLVVDQSGDDRSCFGGMVAHTAHARGAVGAVVAGSCNDYPELVDLGLPVYSKGLSARTTRILGIEGAINVDVTVGGVTVRPGDVVFADSDGVAILNRAEALQIAGELRRKESAEPKTKERITAGERLSEISGARAKFEDKLMASH